MAAQFTSRNGRPARGLLEWMKCAMISLPVPLSPVMNTLVVSLFATLSAVA